ncbi:MAG: DNA primase small subunit domain-containing protein [Promethearchaeota archaeon]
MSLNQKKQLKINQFKEMNGNIYLNRLFKAYYKEKKIEIPIINLFNEREFGFIPWEKHIMIRHVAFRNSEELLQYLIDNGPKHVYSSGSLYLQPDNLEMDKKIYQGCDLIIDIDVDHFYTPCKNNHDLWYCNTCGDSGKGMPLKCPKCKNVKLKTLTWICEDCLKTAKNEIIKLIDDFLISDFGIKENQIKITFSGHRGYHLKIENDRIRTLSSESRREIADYITGDNLSFEILGLREDRSNIFGLLKDNIGWSQKIINKIEDILRNYSNLEIETILTKFGLNKNVIISFMNSKEDLLKVISGNTQNLWNIEGFGIKTWKIFLKGIVKEIGVKIDEPVTIDIHRLIRYPGSLHGKTGFKVQEINLEELSNFNPLNESREKLDPIVFKSEGSLHKLEIIEKDVPITKIKGKRYGPYKKGDIIEVPHHIAVFLLCREVAKSI